MEKILVWFSFYIKKCKEESEGKNMNMIRGKQQKSEVEPEELASNTGRQIRLHGCIYKIRKMKGFAFVLLRTKREVLQCVYTPEKADFPLEQLKEESAVIITAEVIAEERSRTGYDLHLISVEILSEPEMDIPSGLFWGDGISGTEPPVL